MTEIERYDESRMSTLELAPKAWSLAQRVARTEFVPAALRGKPEAVLACFLAGHEVGVSPMQSLAKIHIIDGRPAMAAELMRAIVLRDGHELWIEESTSTSCTLGGQRKGSERETRVTWTLDDAQRAGLKGKQNWQKYPTAMLLARSTGALCRAIFPDVLAGISYTVEELEDGDVLDFPDAIDVPTAQRDEGKPPPNPTTAKASRDATRGADTPAKTEPDPEPPAAREEPPLDGEDDIVDAELVEEREYEGQDQDLGAEARYSGPQLVAMKFGDRGITDRDVKLATVAKIIDREVESTKDLDSHEIGRVLDVLNDDEQWSEVAPEEPPPEVVDGGAEEAPPPASEASPPAEDDPDGWDAARWRAFLKKRGVKVTELLKEAGKLAREQEKAAPSNLDDVAASGLGRLLAGYVEDLALERKGSSS